MAHEISAQGITLNYAMEATAGSKPTTGYSMIANVKSIAEFNPTVNTLDATDLSDLEWRRNIPALKDTPSDYAIGVNMVEANITAWNNLCESAKTAYASGKNCWFEIKVPNWANSFYFAGLPQKIGFPGAEVDSIFDGELHVVPTKVDDWKTKST